MKRLGTFLIGVLTLFLAISLTTCKQDTKDKMKEAGEAVVEEAEAAAETVGDAASQAAEEVGKAADEAADSVKEAAKDVGEAVKDAGEAVSDEINRVRIKFDPGTSSKVVESSITGYEGVDYQLNVKEGQYMNISMATRHGATYFNIMEPGEQYEAIYNGSIGGNQFEGTAAKSGDYTIRVYMMRSAARRNEKADFRLEMIVDN